MLHNKHVYMTFLPFQVVVVACCSCIFSAVLLLGRGKLAKVEQENKEEKEVELKEALNKDQS